MIDDSVEKWQQADEEVRKDLPPGVKLVRTLRGHKDRIGRIAWSLDGRMLASPSEDKTTRIWDAETGECLHTLAVNDEDEHWSVSWSPNGKRIAVGSRRGLYVWKVRQCSRPKILDQEIYHVVAVAWSSDGQILCSISSSGTCKVWDMNTYKMIRKFESNCTGSTNLVFDPSSTKIAVTSGEDKVSLFDARSGTWIANISGHSECVEGLAWSPNGMMVASGSEDYTIRLWNTSSKRYIGILEGNFSRVIALSFSFDNQLLASRDVDGKLIIWRLNDLSPIITILEQRQCETLLSGIVFHPNKPILATLCENDTSIRIMELDLSILLDKLTSEAMVTYTSAKVILVGDSGVGKTGLGWRLSHGEFKEHSSTHGQQFWLLDQLCKKRSDGAQCEAVLWDLAGQPDYRLIHALFLDDADLALVLFDPTHNDDPLSGVEFWLKQLKVGTHLLNGTSTVLIAARSDRGTPRLTKEELDAFCKQRGVKACLLTSAKSGEGIDELVHEMQNLIPWDTKPATVTTETFKRIKDFVLDMKENNRRRKVILTTKELRQRLVRRNRKWNFSDAEMMTAVGHLANHGYVTCLKTSKGEPRILLTPELLNNLAASFILEARRNPEGLGSLEEQRLLSSEYKFPELEKLTEAEQDILLDSVEVLFLEHNICFRETNPLNKRAYLVFPELINLKKPPIGDDTSTEDGVAYTVSGAVENVYASMVVLMGYTQNFTRTNQWQNYARYEVGTGHVCGFHLEEERAGELDFVLYFGVNTPTSVKMIFQGSFESFLARRNLTVQRIEPVLCSKKHTLNRAVVREHMLSGEEFAFCNRCGEKIKLPKPDQPIYLTKKQEKEVKANSRTADQRSLFEQVLFRLKSYVMDQKIISPECFISYAWGNPDQELWVERSLAEDLQKAGIKVILDRWHNPPGSSIGRFIDRLEKVDRIIVVGTVTYRKKYDNEDPESGTVVAAECAQINTRMRGTEEKKATIVPVLLEGTVSKSFPPCLSDQVFSDFRKPETYFINALELLLSLYQIPLQQPVAIELRELLGGQREYKIP